MSFNGGEKSVLSGIPSIMASVTSPDGIKIMSATLAGCFGGYMLQPIPNKLNDYYNERSWQSTGKWIKVFMLTGLIYANQERGISNRMMSSVFIAMMILFVMDVIVAFFEPGESVLPGVAFPSVSVAPSSGFRSRMKTRRSALSARKSRLGGQASVLKR